MRGDAQVPKDQLLSTGTDGRRGCVPAAREAREENRVGHTDGQDVTIIDRGHGGRGVCQWVGAEQRRCADGSKRASATGRIGLYSTMLDYATNRRKCNKTPDMLPLLSCHYHYLYTTSQTFNSRP